MKPELQTLNCTYFPSHSSKFVPTTTSNHNRINRLKSIMHLSDVKEQLHIMQKQEESVHYRASDYLLDFLKRDDESSHTSSPIRSTHCASSASGNTGKPIDEDCRTKMVEWCYQIVDYATLNRDTVAVAMSYLDRYLSTHNCPTHDTINNVQKAILDRKQYQLVCISTLYMAIKLNEAAEISMEQFSALARGVYSMEEMVNMEREILTTLDWRLSGPTSFTFLYLLMQVFPISTETVSAPSPPVSKSSNTETTDSPPIVSQIMNLAIIQLEYAVSNYSFVSCNLSLLASAAILNAIEHITQQHFSQNQNQLPPMSASDRILFGERLKDLIPNLDFHSTEFLTVKNRLLESSGLADITLSALPSSFSSPMETTSTSARHTTSSSVSTSSSSSRNTSPVCVARNSSVVQEGKRAESSSSSSSMSVQ